MRRIASLFAILVGLGSGLLGLLFLVGYGGHLHRLVVGGIGLALCGVLLGVGIKFWKQAQARTPEQVRKDVLSLASKRGGSITEADVVAAISDRAEVATQALQDMVRVGICQPRWVEGVQRYEFPQLQAMVVVRRCSHCGWEAPLMSTQSTCSLCGAPIVVGRAQDEGIGLD